MKETCVGVEGSGHRNSSLSIGRWRGIGGSGVGWWGRLGVGGERERERSGFVSGVVKGESGLGEEIESVRSSPVVIGHTHTHTESWRIATTIFST